MQTIKPILFGRLLALSLAVAPTLMSSASALAADAATPTTVVVGTSARRQATKTVKLSGRVTVDGVPRAGVAVSDGVNVVTTDAKGNYKLSSAGRQHLFVTLPADCLIPLTDVGMPAFYADIDGSRKSQTIDFSLTSGADPDRFRLFTMADIQIGDDKDVSMWENEFLDRMVELAKGMDGNLCGITLGDIVWNNPSLYATYIRNIGRLGIPMLSVIGNHDHNENVKNDTDSDREFRDALGPTYYSVDRGDWHIICLDDVLYSGLRGRNDYAGRITDTQMEWLRQDLARVDTTKSILVGLHIPTSRRYSGGKLANSAELHELLSPYHDVQILSGHTHFASVNHVAPNITETTFPAAMGAFWNGDINNDGSPRGFAMLEFEGNRLTNKYYQGWTTPRDYQIKIYLPDEASFRFGKDRKMRPVKQDSVHLLVNVFFWDKTWQVSLQEDDGAWQRIDPEAFAKIWDPAAVKLLQGRNKWEKRPHAEPADNNDHMFLYKPQNADWKRVRVRAEDGFGNVYTAEAENKRSN